MVDAVTTKASSRRGHIFSNNQDGNTSPKNRGHPPATSPPFIKAEDDEKLSVLSDAPPISEPEDIDIYNIPNHYASIVSFIGRERLRAIQPYAMISRRQQRVPTAADLDKPERRGLPRRIRSFIAWLEANVTMTPQLRQETKIDQALRFMFADPAMHFPDDLKERARALCEGWEADGWGAHFVKEEEDEENPDEQQPVAPVAAGPNAPPPPTIAPPDASDPVFGAHGIMHGVVVTRGSTGRRTYILDARLRKRDARIFGHNGLSPGAWWPLQIAALFHGAHGARMGGIAGDRTQGAYSVVVSGLYEDLDSDQGDIVFYSGANSHSNTDPDRTLRPTAATAALHVSVATGRPIRLLRSASASKNSRFAPRVGIRYDGLYRAVSVQTRRNTIGGLYERFCLERLPDGQPSLKEICASSPIEQQRTDYARFVNSNSGA